jgi:hypothetical protein
MKGHPQSTIAVWIGLIVGVTLALGALSAHAFGQTAASAQANAVTFAKDIAPILQRSCQQCHRPGSVAPMSLLTYEEARPWARAIKYRTGLRDKPEAMPPWYVEKNIGIQKYKEDVSLSDSEIAKIAAWVDAGAPAGNTADMPPARTFADGAQWQIGRPDLIVSSPSFEMRAVSPDWWGWLGETTTGLTEDRYIAAIEIKEITDSTDAPDPKTTTERKTIGGHSIFHHLGWRPVGPSGEVFPEDVGDGDWPTHEVGRNADVLDPAAGLLLRAGSKLQFTSAHMHANGRRTKAHVDVGFKFHPKGYRPTKHFLKFRVMNRELDIKGNEANQKVEGFYVLNAPTKLFAFEPHMHAAGVRMCLDAIWEYTAETLSCVGYNHNWVRTYSFADDAAPLLPKGTILRTTGYFDTTPANKNVSDPRNWMGMGHRSMDNMMAGIMRGVELTEDEFDREMANRRQVLALPLGRSVLGCPLCGYDRTKRPVIAARQQQ